MDYTKNVVGIFALLMMLMLVPTASAFVESGALGSYFDSNPTDAILTSIADGDTQAFRIKTSQDLIANSPVVLLFIPADGTSDNDTIINFVCTYQTTSYNMSESEYWGTFDFTFVPFPLTNLGDGTYGDQCNITVTGEDIRMTTYIFSESQTIISDLYSVPDQAMADLTEDTSDILTSVFDLMEMLLVVTALILFVFVIVFIWKLIEYFATRVSRKGRVD